MRFILSWITALLILMALPRAGLPMEGVTLLAAETVMGKLSAKNGFSWPYAYDIAVHPEKVLVQVAIHLVPEGGVTRMDLAGVTGNWEKGIEETWSNRFAIETESGQRYPIIIDVSFNTFPCHHRVIVRPGGGRSEIIYWNILDSKAVVAHEFGHMIGVYDEYRGGALNPKKVMIDDTSIMTSNPGDGVTYARHYQQFLEWFHKKMKLGDCRLCPIEGEKEEMAEK